MANFKELLVWQKSIDFVTDVYGITGSFPKDEMYGLIFTNQKSFSFYTIQYC